MRHILFSVPVLFMPIMIPHVKMALGCSAYSSGSYTAHPFYPALTCWHGDHAALAGASLVLGLIFFCAAYHVAAFFYEITPPYKDQLYANAITARVHNRVERYLLVAKTVLLILFIAGHKDSWRAPLGLLLFAAGVYVSVLQVRWVPWWEEDAQTCYLFQYMLVAWTGLAGFLMTMLEGACILLLLICTCYSNIAH
jgi:hypothetical protein